jgi:protein subunit release factor A
LTIKRLDAVLEGALDDFVVALTAAEQAERLAEGE